MIWSEPSDQDKCPRCGGPTREKPLRPFPVALQAVFGVSFIAFLILFEQVKTHIVLVWIWSAVQVALGIALIVLRKQAQKTVLRCIRCETVLR